MRYVLTLAFLMLLGARAVLAQPVTAEVDTETSVISYTGSAVLHGFTGVSRRVTGTLMVDMAQPERSTVNLSVPVESFDSGNRRRDADMLDAVDVDEYPNVQFVSTQVTPAGEGVWKVRGDLTFHGKTRSIEVPVQVSTNGGTFEGTGQFEISLADYSVRRPKLLLVPIGDVIHLEFAIHAPLRSSTSAR